METLQELIKRLNLKPSNLESFMGTAKPITKQGVIWVLVNTMRNDYLTFGTRAFETELQAHEVVYEVSV